MDQSPYKTIAARVSAEFIEKKSRFIGTAIPALDEDAALKSLNELRVQYKDASHNCYAYLIGANYGILRYSDDGEPGGTAGLPILEVARQQGITNLLIVVTRYYGGVMLGAGGLTRAYAKGSVLALSKADIVWMLPCVRALVELSYAQVNKMEHYLKTANFVREGADFGASVTVTLHGKADDYSAFEADIMQIFDGKVRVVEVERRIAPWKDKVL